MHELFSLRDFNSHCICNVNRVDGDFKIAIILLVELAIASLPFLYSFIPLIHDRAIEIQNNNQTTVISTSSAYQKYFGYMLFIHFKDRPFFILLIMRITFFLVIRLLLCEYFFSFPHITL